MSLGPIPVSAIYQWCEREQLDPLETEALIYVIREVDNYQQKLSREKMDREQEKNKAKNRR